MSIADDLVGMTLQGRGRSPRQWTVHEKINSIQGHTPGFFSVSYKCRDSQGFEAFLKASDLSKVLSSDPSNMMKLLLDATQAHNFERDVLEYCRGNRMDRVVTAIDFGNENIVHNGVSEFLFFLVFELAEGDLRKRIAQPGRIDLLWIVSALHEYAVAVSQLHNGTIYHNDIKPANALVFGGGGQKIGDLGRATTPMISIGHDQLQCIGDRRFAPPEQLYALDTPLPVQEKFAFHRAGDLYNLGSLAHYLLTGINVTPEIVIRLREEFRPPYLTGGWTDKVGLILPYWTASLAQLQREAKSIAEEFSDDAITAELYFIVDMIGELCEPNWRKRGVPITVGKPNQYDLSRYITRLDLARSRVMVAMKNAK